MMYRSSKSVHRCDLCAWQRDQKRKKRPRKKHDSGKLGIRRDHPRRRIEMKFCMADGLRGSSKVRISSKSVKRFRSCGGGSKFALSHWLGHSLAYTTACTTIVTSRDRTVSYPHAGGAAVLTVTTELWSSVASLKIVHDVIIWGRCTKLNSEPVIVSSTPPLYNISLNMHWHIRIVVHTHIQTMKPLNPSQCVVL